MRVVGDSPALAERGSAATRPTLGLIAQAALADCVRATATAATPHLLRIIEATAGAGLADGAWIDTLEHEPRAAEDRPLAEIAAALGLVPIEILTVALLAAVDEDPMVGRAVAELQSPLGGSRPTLGLLGLAFAELTGGVPAGHVLLGGAAIASGLVALPADDRPLPERPLALPPATYLALRGRDGSWPGATIGAGQHARVVLPPSVRDEAARQARALVEGGRTLVIRTASIAEGRAAASALAEAVGRRAVFLESEVLTGIGPWLELRTLLPVFCYDLAPGDRRQIPALAHYRGPVLALTGPDGLIQASGSSVPDWILGVPPRHEREQLWAAALGDPELAGTLAREQRHGAGRIAQLAGVIQRLRILDGSPRATLEHVTRAAWTDDGPGLAGLALPLRDSVPDEALVATGALSQELALLLLRCRARDGLSEGLGASARTRYRSGVRALFVGPSGTGKTLAAGWLATRLGMPLYRVDLAAVTSKYIGETEKNLAQLLARAEHAGVVLLFDEADSMFGKRTDVKDANDRFANAQTNYLLQRIESFDGVTILTSNSRSRFDAAFTRRLDAILDFVLPGPEERRALWASHLGANHAVTPRLLNKLAAVADLAGGHIRNVVFAAAVLAQASGRPIEYRDIVTGLVAEFRKLGRPMPQELKTEA